MQQESRPVGVGGSAQRQTYPVLYGQRWLVCHADHAPDRARPVQRIYLCRNPLNTAALFAAFRHVVSCHPSLRLRLARDGNEARQYFLDDEATISGLRIRDRTPAIRAAYAQHVIAEESKLPLDLTCQSPFRAKVVEFDGNYVFSLCIDHIAADEIAFDLIIEELERAYKRELDGIPQPASQGSRVFFNYLERESAQRPKEATHLEYWRARLAGAPLCKDGGGALELVPGISDHWKIDGHAYQALLAACRSQRCSLFHAVIAAFASLIVELCETDDIVINVPVSNRTQASDYEIVANLSMLLHVRLRLPRGPRTPLELRAVRDQLAEDMVHRFYNYADLRRVVASDAMARGGTPNWLVGCSFVVERSEPAENGALFVERYDNRKSRTFNIPQSAFTITCRSSKQALWVSAERDAWAWRAVESNLPQRFCDLLARVVGIESFNPDLIDL